MNFTESLQKILLLVEGILYPNRCVGCRKEDVVLCGECLSRIPRAGDAPIGEAAIEYRDPVARRALWLFKYHKHQKLAGALATLLEEAIIASLGDSLETYDITRFVVVSILLSPEKLRARGYNQSELIASHVSKSLKIPLVAGLEKTRETRPQMSLPRKERLTNVQDVFRANKGVVAGKHIILIDDIITTGATLRSARGALLEAGSKKVFPFAVAH